MSYNRSKQLMGLLFFLSPFILAPCYAWYSMRPMAFSETEWRTGDERLRGRMAKSVEFQNSLKVLTEKEVLEKLGEPDYRSVGFAEIVRSPRWLYFVKTDYLSLGATLAIQMQDGRVHGVGLSELDS